MAARLPIPSAMDSMSPPIIGVKPPAEDVEKGITPVAGTAPTLLTTPVAGGDAGTAAVKIETPVATPVSNRSSVVARREVAEKAKGIRASFKSPAVWMLVFGIVLVVCAGTVNVVAFRGLGTFVSHVSGTSSKVGMRIEGVTTGGNDLWDLGCSVSLVCSFIFGSFLCGLVIPKGQVHFGGKSFYGIALIMNSMLLVAATFVAPRDLNHHDRLTDVETVIAGCLTAMACGLQNAMCTMHFGAVVRTTHVTGTATDIGSTSGRAAMLLLRRGCRCSRLSPLEQAEMEVDTKKLKVLLPLFFGFGAGCVLGAFLFSVMGVHALLVPATVTGISGTIYWFFRTQLKQKLKRLEGNWLKVEIQEVEEQLARAHSYLKGSELGEGSCRHGSERNQNLDDVDSQIGHALEVVHDVEHTLMELVTSVSAYTLESGKVSHHTHEGSRH